MNPENQQPYQPYQPDPSAYPFPGQGQQIQQPPQQFPGQFPQQQPSQPFPGQPLTPGQNPQQPIATPPAPATKEAKNSSQENLLISEIRDGVVVLKDGSFRAVVACQSINFDLMSETEREAIEYSYQSFLNSLGFDIQILIRSQRVDIGPYLDKLSKIRRENDNMLLGVLMDDYIEFITTLSQEANIMDKAFFIVIPFFSSITGEKVVEKSKSLFKDLFSSNNGPQITKIDRASYEKAVSELSKRVDLVTNGLMQIGVRAVRLNTKELGTLYYDFNNPDTATREPLIDFSKLATTYVKKGVKNV
jgi:hypothetical protein